MLATKPHGEHKDQSWYHMIICMDELTKPTNILTKIWQSLDQGMKQEK